ncbi:hypothetical protein [Tautonia sociabilis]|uniref:Uncharacterized protein n=1 Tax=Tautonia sociabilis TaxID=2080755 RepID=A0A432MP11_9BACT|nr:hypothetical protein [Tautonia sociabilis]RUL89181.1 hypothetical protein TsocGM_03435 [Tautonia sociabilis]
MIGNVLTAPVPTIAEAGDPRPTAEAPESPASGPKARLAGLLGAAIDRPAELLCALLAANAVFQPYRGRYHDSILYGVQLLNRASGGRHREDLFLRFGSQDDYSLYSRIGAPLVRLLGVETASALMYLACVVLFYWALSRLVRAIVPDRRVAAAGLLAIAVSAVAMGGRSTFHVNENFLTPRLPSVALAMIGLERLLAGRRPAAAAALAGSMAMHPLMGLGGVLVALAWGAGRWVSPAVLAGLALLGAAAVAISPALGALVFGEMDPQWYGEVLLRSRYMVGSEWPVGDWLRVFGSFAVLLAAIRLPGLPARPAAMLAAVGVAATAGAAGAMLAGSQPLALLLQGQPFRVLWPLELLRIPLGFLVASRLWAQGGSACRTGAVLLAGLLTIDEPGDPELTTILVVGAGAALLLRGVRQRPRSSGWAWQGAAIGVGAASLLKLVTIHQYLAPNWGKLARLIDLDSLMAAALAPIDPIIRLAAAGVMLAALVRLAGPGARFRTAALTVFLGMQAVGAATSNDRFVGEPGLLREDDRRMVAAFLADRLDRAETPPSVYWPGHLNDLWFDLGANCYYDYYQAAGIAFRRETAREARRRLGTTAPFERFEVTNQRLLHNAKTIEEFVEYIGAGSDPGPPRLEDLIALCTDPLLDVAVLRQGYEGWYSAGNGRWFIYDSKFVRARAAALSGGDAPPAGRAPREGPGD